jgi:hypothetical protein
MVNGKRAFWQALVFSLVIFLFGLAIGYFYEDVHVNRISQLLAYSEIDLFDQQLRSSFLTNTNLSCDIAVGELFNFADRVYSESSLLELYDESSKFTDTLLLLHRKYDLLRSFLWIDSISLNLRCPEQRFHTIVYVYDYLDTSVETKAKQQFYAHLLLDLKYAHPNQVLLIPLAADTNLSSVDTLLRRNGIDSIPSIILDDRQVISDIVTLEELEGMLFNRHN